MNDHAHAERQRFIREQAEKVMRDAMTRALSYLAILLDLLLARLAWANIQRRRK